MNTIKKILAAIILFVCSANMFAKEKVDIDIVTLTITSSPFYGVGSQYRETFSFKTRDLGGKIVFIANYTLAEIEKIKKYTIKPYKGGGE